MIDNEIDARIFCAARTDAAGMERLTRFAARLGEENGRQNLVSGASLAAVWQRHLADSLQLLDLVQPGPAPWLDLGTGAGFPGLALAAARPEQGMVLVESRKRRVEWLGQMIGELELVQCRVIGARLENVETFAAGAIFARAFAPLDKLLTLSARFSTHHTAWLLPKGRSAAQELAGQEPSIRAMFHVEQSRTDPGGGILVGRGTPIAP
jgi:16S rRNA (guanine527-N7)-methyltransferase